jgi:adenosylcobinamide kinase/adenosylcobinamide-phosphate guanylyltransferase
MRILLVGGSKSSKSGLAQRLVSELARGQKKYYWATMEPTDGEDRERIARHLKDRDGLGFETVERGRDILSSDPLPRDCAVLFDSVTALLANEMFGEVFDDSAPEKALRELLELSSSAGDFVCVCDEIFMGGEEYGGWTEKYVRGLASVLRGLASEFDTVCEVVSGIPRIVKGSLPEGF